jgi:hypothetical protein
MCALTRVELLITFFLFAHIVTLLLLPPLKKLKVVETTHQLKNWVSSSLYDILRKSVRNWSFTDNFCFLNDRNPLRDLPLPGRTWFTYYRCSRHHLKCHFLQIELNNWLVHMFQRSIKASLIAVSVEQLIFLSLTKWCVLSFLSITLQRWRYGFRYRLKCHLLKSVILS